MSDFLIYSTTTGVIDKVFSADSSELSANTPDGMSAIYATDGANDETHFVDVGLSPHSVCPKINMPLSVSKMSIAADGLDFSLISGIPIGASVVWPDGDFGVVPDGFIEFSVTQPGVYTILISGGKYKSEEISIEATI